MLAAIFLTLLAGYVLGSLNGAIVVSRYLLHDDVRTHGSGNAGLTNFLRSYGGPATFLVIAIDMGKVLLSCWLGGIFFRATGSVCEGQMLGGLAAVLGHSYPVFYGFQGGKGILSTGTLAIFMDWRIFAVLFVLFLLIVLVTRYVSLGSIVAAVVYPICFALVFWSHPWVVAMSLVGWFDVWRHRANIQRLLHGTENKFSIRHRGGPKQ